MHEEPTATPAAINSQAGHGPGPRRRRKRILWISVAATLIVFVAAGLLLYLHTRNNGPLPRNIVKSANFPLYYPSPLPVGYDYKNGSGKVEGGIVFYTLQSGGKTIAVSEQAVPPNPPDLTHLTGFTNLQTLAGSAAIGTSLGQPIAIVLSNTTLITITGHKNVPSDIVAQFAKAMSSLGQ